MSSRARPLHPAHDVDIGYELIVTDDGLAYLTCGGEVLWSSDADDEYAEAFDDEFVDVMDEEQTDKIIEWLQEEGYMPPDVEVGVIREEDNIDASDV
jgi:hypothetical protein